MADSSAKDLADACLKAAELHLKRLEVLQGAEWRITVLCWTLLVAVAGGTLLHQQVVASIPIVTAACLFYVFIAFAYLRLYQPQSYQSLNTERNYYVYMRNLAFQKLGLPEAVAPDRHGTLFGELTPAIASDVRSSKVYQFRRAVTVALALLGMLITVAPLLNR